MPQPTPLSGAEIQWDPEGRPLSSQYQDVYFSKANGLEETRYVFLQHNDLPRRWEKLEGHQPFTIAETGFGTGLNFLTTWHCWQREAPRDARLHFISVEKHPLSPTDLDQALSLWPELTHLRQALLERYPPGCAGFHRLIFDQGRVTLSLLLGDAHQQLSELEARVDAWYLDGFAPAKNPQMWTEPLFSAMSRLSREGSTFSTFTAAGSVKRGLQAQGFEVRKVPGFGRKREMLCGSYRTPRPAAEPAKPWFMLPSAITRTPGRALVIGAGIAGCSAARSLAERGWHVQLLDRHPAPAQAASGNDQGVLYAKLPAVPTLHSRIHLAGYLFTLRRLPELLPPGLDWDPCGLIQLATGQDALLKQNKLLQAQHYPPELVRGVDAAEASELAGCQLPTGGLFFPASGWIHPPALCRALIQHPNIEFIPSFEVARLQRDSHTNRWRVEDGQAKRTASAPVVIIANADQARSFAPLAELPLKSIRGQVSSFPQPPGTGLQTVLCGNSYISPPRQQRFCFGATFDLHHQHAEVSDHDHLENLANTRRLAPELADALAAAPREDWRGRVGFRCASPDYLPLVGPVAEQDAYLRDFAELRRDAKAIISASPSYHPGLYLSVGHGSKGMITAPLAAEILASQICNDPLPIECPLLDALHPGRFIIKDLIRRAI